MGIAYEVLSCTGICKRFERYENIDSGLWVCMLRTLALVTFLVGFGFAFGAAARRSITDGLVEDFLSLEDVLAVTPSPSTFLTGFAFGAAARRSITDGLVEDFLSLEDVLDATPSPLLSPLLSESALVPQLHVPFLYFAICLILALINFFGIFECDAWKFVTKAVSLTFASWLSIIALSSSTAASDISFTRVFLGVFGFLPALAFLGLCLVLAPAFLVVTRFDKGM